MIKKSISTLIFVIAALHTFGQQAELLTLDLIFSGQLRQERLGNLEWMQTTEGFTKLEGNSLKLYDIKEQEWITLVSAADLAPEGSENPISVRGYSWSSDEKKLLIFTNTQRVWRQNTVETTGFLM
jgi:dipeptidyl-peptidase-4